MTRFFPERPRRYGIAEIYTAGEGGAIQQVSRRQVDLETVDEKQLIDSIRDMAALRGDNQVELRLTLNTPYAESETEGNNE